jgi:hypothetical protein
LSKYLDRNLASAILNIRKYAAYDLQQTCLSTFGFQANPDATFWQNQNRILGAMPPGEYFAKPTHMAFHNLCHNLQPPPGSEYLLGMSLKFCLETPRPWQTLGEGLSPFHHLVHLHFFFKSLSQTEDSDSEDSNPDRNTTYIQSLYRPSEWNPPIINRDAERALHKFDQCLTAIEKNLLKFRRYNLTPSQRHVLKELAKRSDLILNPTDKGLGPSVSEQTRYMRQVLTEHLLNSENYDFIPPEYVQTELAAQRARFIGIHAKWGDTVPSEAEATYFEHALTKSKLNATRIPQIYGMYKVHKTGHQK